MRPRSLPARVPRAVQLAGSLGALALLWHLADGPQAARRLAGADPVWLLAGLAALTLQTVLSALRWRLTAAQFGIRLEPATAVREYYLAQIVNQALPGGVVGDAARAVRARGQAGLMASGQAVVLERLAGQIAIFAVFALAFVATLAVPGGLDWPPTLVLPLAGLVAATIALPLAVGLLRHRISGRAGQGLRVLAQGVGRGLAAPGIRGRQLAYSLATALCNVAAFVCCARAVGTGLSPAAALALVPLILSAMVIPLSVGSWGLREGAAAALFPLAGIAAAEGLAATLAFSLMLLVSVLPGAVLPALKTAAGVMKSIATRHS